MTDYAATIYGRGALVHAELAQLTAKRLQMGRQDGDDVELRQATQQLHDVLDGRWIEIDVEVKRTSALTGRVASLEGQLGDRNEELRVTREQVTRLRAENKRLKALAPKAEK